MGIEEIKKKIRLAINVVEDVPEPFRTKAFEVVLSSMLAGLSPKISSPPIRAETQSKKRISSIESKIEELAKVADIEVNQLRDIFHFGEKEPTFIGNVSGGEAEKQVQISRLLLLVMHDVYRHEWIKSSFLWKALEDCGVGSLAHLSRNLKRRRTEFRAIGQKKGKKYKLTGPGRQNAIESLRQLIV